MEPGAVPAPTDDESVCVACGMCCDGTLFRSVGIRDDDDRAALAAVGVTFWRRSAGDDAFAQPCGALDGARCTVYARRPHACRVYSCRVVAQLERGTMSRSDALALIAAARSLRDRLRPTLAAHLTAEERGVLDELYRIVLAKFEPASLFARATGESPSSASSGAGDGAADQAELAADRLALTDGVDRVATPPSGSRAELADRRGPLLERYRAIVDAPATERATVLAELVALYHALGDVTAAAGLGGELAQAWEEIGGADDRHTLLARAAVATWSGLGGRTAQAVSLHREVLADRTRVLGPDDADTLAARHDVADWTGVDGSPGPALEQLTTLLGDELRVLGPDHPVTLRTRTSVAYWTGVLGDAGAALTAYREVLADRLRVQGPDHVDTLRARWSVAALTAVTGDPERALDLASDLLFDRVRVLGNDHPETKTLARTVTGWTRRATGPAPR